MFSPITDKLYKKTVSTCEIICGSPSYAEDLELDSVQNRYIYYACCVIRQHDWIWAVNRWHIERTMFESRKGRPALLSGLSLVKETMDCSSMVAGRLGSSPRSLNKAESIWSIFLKYRGFDGKLSLNLFEEVCKPIYLKKKVCSSLENSETRIKRSEIFITQILRIHKHFWPGAIIPWYQYSIYPAISVTWNINNCIFQWILDNV